MGVQGGATSAILIDRFNHPGPTDRIARRPGGVAEWFRQGPAKPRTAVRFRPPPPSRVPRRWALCRRASGCVDLPRHIHGSSHRGRPRACADDDGLLPVASVDMPELAPGFYVEEGQYRLMRTGVGHPNH